MSITQNNASAMDAMLQNLHQYNIDIKNREIFLHSPLEWEEEGGVDYRSAIVFEKNVRYLNLISNEPILVHMHLPGGDWQDCLGIYDCIRSSKSKIIILAYAKVESASSVLFQAADYRILMPNTHVLIHYGSLTVDNEHKAAIASLQWSEKESEKMIEIFTEKCLQSPIAAEKNWKKFIVKKHLMSQLANKSDWILNAEEAIYYGFADGVLGSKQFPDIDTLKNKCSNRKKNKP